MLFEILLAIFFGIIVGTITGLAPGIHINLVGALLVSLSLTLLYPLEPIYLIVFIVATSITHTFIDFIPSIFLGCPNTDTELSILPGHELLKEGRGHEAVMLTAYGGLFAVGILIFTAVPLIIFVPKIYAGINNIIPYILIAVALLMIFSEKKKFSAFLAMFLAGVLGIIILNPFQNPNLELGIKEPLLPLLTGLFGASSLILSIKTKTKIPKQIISKPKPKILRPLIATFIASPLCGFLPGLGSSQAAIIGSAVIKNDQKGFLVLLGSTNTLIMGLSFISLYTIHKMRTGTAATIDKLIGSLDAKTLTIILLTCVVAGITAFFLTSVLAKKFIKILEKINYSKMSFLALGLITVSVLIFSGFAGVVVFIVSTITGIYCISLGVRRTIMMSCLLIPTIILYLF